MYRKRVRVIQFEEYIEREVREFYFYSSSTRLVVSKNAAKGGATKTHKQKLVAKFPPAQKKSTTHADDKRERETKTI